MLTSSVLPFAQHIAFEFAKLGAKLVLAARREDRLQSVADICEQLGSPDVEVVQADVRKEDDCKKIIDHAIHKFDRREFLILKELICFKHLDSSFALEVCKRTSERRTTAKRSSTMPFRSLIDVSP